jgi:hypothetical protein
VFDCGPVDITKKAVLEATQQVLGEIAARFVLAGFYALLPDPEFEQRARSFASTCSTGAAKTPKLYLYSTADKIADSRFIESLQVSGRTQSYNFVVPRHCALMRVFPKVYLSQIHLFLDKVLRDTGQQKSRL